METPAAERKRKERICQQERINHGKTIDWTVADCCLVLSNGKYNKEQQFKAVKQLIKLKKFSKIKLLF
jgi:hypothetical protein